MPCIRFRFIFFKPLWVIGILKNVFSSDFIYETRNELLQSSYYKHMSQLSEDVDQFYNDLLENEMATNAAKYYELFLNFLQKKTNFKELSELLPGKVMTSTQFP